MVNGVGINLRNTVKHMEEFEHENQRLKRLVADEARRVPEEIAPIRMHQLYVALYRCRFGITSATQLKSDALGETEIGRVFVTASNTMKLYKNLGSSMTELSALATTTGIIK